MSTDIAEIQKTYPNNGFGSYWRHSGKRSPFRSQPWRAINVFWNEVNTGYRLTCLILKDAGIELFFLLSFWLIITKMSQGRDLIVSLFEPDGIYNQWRIFYTVLSAVSLSFSMWIIPAFLFQRRDQKNMNRPGYQSAFKKHLFFAHRVLPLIPFWLLASVLFNQKGMTLLFLGISALQLSLLYWFNKKIKTRKTRMVYGAVVFALFIASVFYFKMVYKETYTEAKIALTVILYMIAFLLHFIFHEVDIEILKEHKLGDKNSNALKKYWFNSLCYFLFFLVHVGLLFLFFSDRRTHLAPESIMLYIFSLYVFLIDLLIYYINLTPQRKFVAWFFIVVIVVIYLSSSKINLNLNHYTLDTITDSSVLKGAQRLDFENRYADLKRKIDSNETGKPYPIILISGEGGGSRAAVWFSQNLINFDYHTRGKFRDHIFSISTVSGSSVGLGGLFTFWELSDKNNIDSGWLELPSKIYANNFVGSSVKGMLLTDLWKSIIPFAKFEGDRNSTLQDEESFYTQLAAREIREKTTLSVKTSIPNDERLLSKDFMNFFYRREGDSLVFKDRPMVFINSCRSNDGRRGIISPVKLTDDVFNDAIDIGGYLYEDSICDYKNNKLGTCFKRNLSFGQACNLSELFPLFSAPAYIDSLGSFVDGGYHENSGLKTTLDVYLNLKKKLDRDGVEKSRYTIYILYFKNGGGKKDLYKGMKSELPFSLPIKALTSQPFEGSASYFEEKARFVGDSLTSTEFLSIQLDNHLIKDTSATTSTQRVKKKRNIEEEILNDLRTEKDADKLSFPLARWLSKSVIKRMRLATFPVKVNPQRDDVKMVELLEKINAFHTVRPASNEPFREWTPNADSLMRQQKKEKIFQAN